MAAESINLLAKARHGVRVILMIVQHTFGGLLNFNPHLHVLVSVGGLREADGCWISRLKCDKQAFKELMHCWRFAVITYLAEALKRPAIGPGLSGRELRTLLEEQHMQHRRKLPVPCRIPVRNTDNLQTVHLYLLIAEDAARPLFLAEVGL